MALVSALTSVIAAQVGDMEYTVATVSSLVGLQEIETGWLLCNGATLPGGTQYDALRTILGTLYGSTGTLPSLIDGVQPIGRGSSIYTAHNTTDGATTVTLSLVHVDNHTHTYNSESTAVGLTDGWANLGSTPPFDDGGYWVPSSFNSAGGGGAHNNMPPYLVIEGMLVKY